MCVCCGPAIYLFWCRQSRVEGLPITAIGRCGRVPSVPATFTPACGVWCWAVWAGGFPPRHVHPRLWCVVLGGVGGCLPSRHIHPTVRRCGWDPFPPATTPTPGGGYPPCGECKFNQIGKTQCDNETLHNKQFTLSVH